VKHKNDVLRNMVLLLHHPDGMGDIFIWGLKILFSNIKKNIFSKVIKIILG
jgi:hypothetical protein